MCNIKSDYYLTEGWSPEFLTSLFILVLPLTSNKRTPTLTHAYVHTHIHTHTHTHIHTHAYTRTQARTHKPLHTDYDLSAQVPKVTLGLGGGVEVRVPEGEVEEEEVAGGE